MDLPHQSRHYQGNDTQRLRESFVAYLGNQDVSPRVARRLIEFFANLIDKGLRDGNEDKRK